MPGQLNTFFFFLANLKFPHGAQKKSEAFWLDVGKIQSRLQEGEEEEEEGSDVDYFI